MGLSFLANRHLNVSKPILIIICELISRITKLGWIENEELTDLITQASKFFQVIFFFFFFFIFPFNQIQVCPTFTSWISFVHNISS